jgi:hypothetical protein
MTKNFTNGIKPITALRIYKFMLGVRKFARSDMDGSTPYGNQATHFITSMESQNVTNFTYNCKNASITFETRPTICISLASEEKT